ncbi:MAG TPA: hypothetical protein VFW33_15350 [Gemmataceae bacterium]|nr:hypothetical protein [Gemmataceae bacterium]
MPRFYPLDGPNCQGLARTVAAIHRFSGFACILSVRVWDGQVCGA